MYLIIPTTLVHVLFCTAIPTLPINFIQLFFMLVILCIIMHNVIYTASRKWSSVVNMQMQKWLSAHNCIPHATCSELPIIHKLTQAR